MSIAILWPVLEPPLSFQKCFSRAIRACRCPQHNMHIQLIAINREALNMVVNTIDPLIKDGESAHSNHSIQGFEGLLRATVTTAVTGPLYEDGLDIPPQYPLCCSYL